MGKQRQQRRSAKKNKGGKKGREPAGQNEGTIGELVKCSACRQLVKREDTIACPNLECGRIFCTEKCAKSCIIRCADPICPSPNRCRPCAFGRTLERLERRNQRCIGAQTELSSMHTPYTQCDCCENQVCSQCKYFEVCSQCERKVCFECIDSEKSSINFCFGPCKKCYCSGCDDGFDIYTKQCTECTVEAQFSLCGGERSHNLFTGKMMFLGEDLREIADEVVLEFAKESKKALKIISRFSGILKTDALMHSSIGGTDRMMVESGYIDKYEQYEEGTNKRETANLTARIIRRTGRSTESTAERVSSVFDLYLMASNSLLKEISETNYCMSEHPSDKEDHKEFMTKAGHLNRQRYVLSMQRLDLSRGVLSALLPDILSMLDSFHMMESLVSDSVIVEIQTIHLDVMQHLYTKEVCGYCLRPTPDGDDTKRCGGCSAIRYCDAKCQALSWPVHRHHCERMKIARGDYNDKILEKKQFEAGLEKTFCGWPGEEYLDQSKA